jgi:microcystin-dependent protein
MGVPLFKDNAWGQLSTSIAPTDTSCTMQSGQGANFPLITSGSGDWFYIWFITSANVLECVQVTATSGDTFTIVRGVQGTTPGSFAASTRVECRVAAAYMDDIMQAIANVQANLTSAITALVAELNVAIPPNLICEWGGSQATIPTGWVICDGRNGTPNLEGQFVVGAGGAYAVGATGGSATSALVTANLPAHNHGISDPGHNHSIAQSGHAHGLGDPGHSHGISDPGHVHQNPGGSFVTLGGGGGNGLASGGQSYNFQSQTTGNTSNIGTYASGTGISMGAANANVSNYASATGISTTNTGSGTAFNNLPPYYALCYIMRTATWS